MTNRHATYYTPYGSYDGALKVKGAWVRAKELNRIDKTGMIRWQGPPSDAIVKAMSCPTAYMATELVPQEKEIVL